MSKISMEFINLIPNIVIMHKFKWKCWLLMSYGDFVVWAPQEILILRIPVDQDFTTLIQE